MSDHPKASTLPQWEPAAEPEPVPGAHLETCRLRVPGGWLYRVHAAGVGLSVAFVPDPAAALARTEGPLALAQADALRIPEIALPEPPLPLPTDA